MAGVGFELKKLFRDHGILQNAKAYVSSSVTTIGPMILCMLMVVVIQSLMAEANVGFLERELFLATVVYGFIFSVLITGGLSMVLTRFIADQMYYKRFEHLLSSYYGGIAVCLPIGLLFSWTFLGSVTAGMEYKAPAYLFFALLVVIWVQTVHLSALKDYKRIVRNFTIGVAVSLVGAFVLLQYTSYGSAATMLMALDAGFTIIVLLSGRHFEQAFPARRSDLIWKFLKYVPRYPSLLFIGTFFYAGVYVHSFVYWIADGTVVAGGFRISPFYDLPVFYAYLTVVPTLVTFVVSLETRFYEKYRAYYVSILNGGTLQDIARARTEMQRTLIQEISFIMEVQLLFTVVSMALGIKFLPTIGFTMKQLDTFNLLVLGYFLFIMAFVVMLVMMYYDDRKGALWMSGSFVVLNAGLSYWTMSIGFDGLGMFIASFLILVAALIRMMTYARNIDYYTFCSQPIAPIARSAKRKKWRRLSLPGTAVLLAAVLLIAGCTPSNEAPQTSAAPTAYSHSAESAASTGLREDKRLYERDDDLSVKALYITVLPDSSGGDKPMTWYGLNRITELMDEKDLDIIVQEGEPDGSGPKSGMFGYGTTAANGKIGIRGNTTRYSAQRSYSVKLQDSAGLWNDQKRLNLNKHIWDATRIRNKITFDLFEKIPNMASLRTQFIRLYVKDLSENGGIQSAFKDYGLYTHVEQPNKTFLKNHWLDPNGQLYKATMFEFFRYEEELKSQDDPAYDKAKFETVLEIRGREDHDKLLTMLDDVNDYEIPINEVMDKHFDLDNYLTWLAMNILTDNMDTNAQNFLLYSPLNSEKWYFIPWDYDGAWELLRRSKSISPYSSGISNYWGSRLHNRFLRSPENVRLLKDKIDEVYANYINAEKTNELISRYRPIVEPYFSVSPDRDFFPAELNELDEEFSLLAGVPLRSIERFNADLEKPRPFFIGEVERTGDTHRFVWDPSFDLQGEDLSYEWTLAKDPGFAEIVDERTGLKETSLEVPGLQPGVYYFKVIARDAAGNSQLAFEYLEEMRDPEGYPYYGVKSLKVE